MQLVFTLPTTPGRFITVSIKYYPVNVFHGLNGNPWPHPKFSVADSGYFLVYIFLAVNLRE